MLRLGPDDNKERIAAVSRKTGDLPQVLTVMTTWRVEILQGSSLVAPPASPKRASCLWCFDDYLPTLYSLTVDGERKHP